MKFLKIFTIVLALFIVFNLSANKTLADDVSCSSQADCQNLINSLQSKLTDLKGQANTLSNQIAVMNGQIELTQARIDATQAQIISLEEDIDSTTQKIGSLNNAFQTLSKIFYNRIRKSYEVGTQPPIQSILASNNISDFVNRENYLQIVEANDRQVAFATVQAKDDYTNQKQILETKKQQVVSLQAQLQQYTDQLNTQKTQKQTLLTETQNSEENYQHLLNQAKAQLAGFGNFVAAQGGASLLSNQTVCDGWGCYYNQRDSQWGGIGINGTDSSIASYGCLMTSMAMVITHYGHKVTPLDINSNSSNFFSSTAYLLFTISAGGVSAQRANASIDSVLSGGDPVIVGISYDGGPIADHFVVLISGSNGNYQMNDPFTPNGHDISFRGTYPTEPIVEVDRVQIL